MSDSGSSVYLMRRLSQSMLRLAFLWHSRFTLPDMLNNWQDGLRGALTLLADKWSVRVFAPYGEAQATVNGLGITMTPGAESCLQACKDWKPDVVLCWGSIDRPLHARVRELGVPTALCFAGGSPSHANRENFDLIFVETDYHLPFFEGCNVRKAFGINTDLFRPTEWQRPHFLGVLPAAFAAYKRYDLFARAMGKDGLAVGQVQTQPDGSVFEAEVCHEVCLREGVTVIPRLVPYYLMPYIFGMAKTAVLTSTTYGGCDRTVLEALACEKPVVACKDNQKLKILLNGLLPMAEPDPKELRRVAEEVAVTADRKGLRQYVVDNFSHYIYARQLREGIESIV